MRWPWLCWKFALDLNATMRYLLLRSAIHMIDNIMYYELIRFWICKWKAEAPFSRRCGCQGLQQEEHAVITSSQKKQEDRSKRKKDKRTAFWLQAGSWGPFRLELSNSWCRDAHRLLCMRACDYAQRQRQRQRQGQRQRPARDRDRDRDQRSRSLKRSF